MLKYPTNFSIYNNPPEWAIPPKDMITHEGDHISGWIKRERFYEAHILEIFKEHFPANSIIFDIGANIGNHSLMFNKLFPDSTIFSFEASPYNFIYLYQNVMGNDKITPYCIGLSNKREIIKFSHYSEDYGGSGVSSVNDLEKESVKNKIFEMDILLNPFDSLNIELVPNVIKLDVENYEIPVLEGMMGVLTNNSPLIWVEDHPLEKQQNLENSPTLYLKNLEYEPIAMCECNVLLKKGRV